MIGGVGDWQRRGFLVIGSHWKRRRWLAVTSGSDNWHRQRFVAAMIRGGDALLIAERMTGGDYQCRCLVLCWRRSFRSGDALVLGWLVAAIIANT